MAVRIDDQRQPGSRAGTRSGSAARAAGHLRLAIRLLLLVTDTIAIVLAFACAYQLRFRSGIDLFYARSDSPLTFYSSLVFWLVPVALLILAGYRLYTPERI